MTTAAATGYQEILIEALVASTTNPRTHFDDAYISELAGSILERGLIQPIIVRPNGKAGTFEIVAGECRFRACKWAKLARVPAIVREMTDNQVLEAQLEENIHRKDLTPLEESAGYRRLIASNPTKHSAESIASRIGMSVGYVWDRLKLADLIPEAKDILDQARMTVGHAILISRLKPEDQKRAVTVPKQTYYGGPGRDVGLWRADHSFNFDGEKGVTRGKYDGVKPCTVRELEEWIQDHVRFDVAHAAKAQPLAFEAIGAEVEAATALPGRGRKVIAITLEQRVKDDARADDERTYGSESWKRADGKGSKTCDHSVLGLVVAGRKQGSTLRVCVNRDKCRVHFGDVIKRKAKNTTLRDTGQAKKADRNEAKQREREETQRQQREIEEQRREVVEARAYDRIVASVDELTPELLRTILGYMLDGDMDLRAFEQRFKIKWQSVGALKGLSGVQLAKALAFATASCLAAYGSFDEAAEVFGVSLKKIDAEIAAEQAAAAKVEKPAKPAPAKKAAKKR